jgi:heme exporter protein D
LKFQDYHTHRQAGAFFCIVDAMPANLASVLSIICITDSSIWEKSAILAEIWHKQSRYNDRQNGFQG